MDNYSSNIKSFDDFKKTKQQLKREIEGQEFELKNNPITKISSSFFGKESSKSFNLSNTLSSKDYKKTSSKLINSFLFANKSTRKYFVAYTIAKEMIPFTLKKVNELIKK